jgi:hypothetical protein
MKSNGNCPISYQMLVLVDLRLLLSQIVVNFEMFVGLFCGFAYSHLHIPLGSVHLRLHHLVEALGCDE